jgi:hypothetical protein
VKQRATFVIPTDRFLAAVAAVLLSAQPAIAQQSGQQSGTPPKPVVGEAQGPRPDGTTRSGAPTPRPAASTVKEVPKSERDAKNLPGYKKGSSTPRDSGSGSILGTPK